jgi:hypothetical protein
VTDSASDHVSIAPPRHDEGQYPLSIEAMEIIVDENLMNINELGAITGNTFVSKAFQIVDHSSRAPEFVMNTIEYSGSEI